MSLPDIDIGAHNEGIQRQRPQGGGLPRGRSRAVRRQTAYESPPDPGRVCPIDRFGYARSVYPAAIEQAFDCGRYALESDLDGIRHLVDGKPYYMGREN